MDRQYINPSTINRAIIQDDPSMISSESFTPSTGNIRMILRMDAISIFNHWNLSSNIVNDYVPLIHGNILRHILTSPSFDQMILKPLIKKSSLADLDDAILVHQYNMDLLISMFDWAAFNGWYELIIKYGNQIQDLTIIASLPSMNIHDPLMEKYLVSRSFAQDSWISLLLSAIINGNIHLIGSIIEKHMITSNILTESKFYAMKYHGSNPFILNSIMDVLS
jgi:hypothetical protein